MYSALKKFLALHHHLALPGIGNLTVQQIPASINIANRCVDPPVYKINFNNETASADKQFFYFLAQEMNVDEVQAIRSFTDFTAQLQLDINNHKEAVIKNVGKIYKQASGIMNFEPEAMPVYLPALVAERVIRKNATHTVTVGEAERSSAEMHAALQEEAVAEEIDRWWIPAVVLGLIGIAALIYYYNVLHHTFFK